MSPQQIVLVIVVLGLSISAHESAHAYVADRCGDPTGRLQGRISVNPLDHVDPIGTILVPALLIMSNQPPFGWARPVPVNPANLRHPRRDRAKVAAAGPGINLVLAFVSLLLTAVFGPLLDDRIFFAGDGLRRLLISNTQINTLLAVFNMIPVPPLDGGGVLQYYLEPRWARWMEQNRQMLSFGLLALILLGGFRYVLAPFLNLVMSLQRSLLILFWGV